MLSSARWSSTIILSGKASGWSGGLGQNGWGRGYLGEYNWFSAFVFEVVATFLFLVVILGVTRRALPCSAGFAGLSIGLTLTAIHIVGINVTGVSVNPARSIGPALIGVVQPKAFVQLWLFIIAPILGAGARDTSSRRARCSRRLQAAPRSSLENSAPRRKCPTPLNRALDASDLRLLSAPRVLSGLGGNDRSKFAMNARFPPGPAVRRTVTIRPTEASKPTVGYVRNTCAP